jgi:methylthioribose-1-phosphate isomerase
MRTIEWIETSRTVRLIDQRKLPNQLEYLTILNAEEMVRAIQTMAIRGAPALGVAGAFGLVLEAQWARGKRVNDLRRHLHKAADLLSSSRPTAVNLAWGVNRVLALVDDHSIDEPDLVERLLAESQLMAEEDIATNLRMAEFGASLINDGDTIVHHCNTGSLAAVDWGTALGAIRYAFEHGKKIHLLIDETRPRFQGARLTAWECELYGIPFDVIPDNAAGYFIHHGDVNKVMFGADRVAANGDVVNKVGTYMLSLAAFTDDVPVYPVFPFSTLDISLTDGSKIPIEERPAEEVTAVSYQGETVYTMGTSVRNPAFDLTPNRLITAWVMDQGVIYPPFSRNLSRCNYNNAPNR